MRAVVADGSGGPEILSVAELADPTPGPGEVQLQIAPNCVGALEDTALDAVLQAVLEHVAGVRDQLVIIEFDDGYRI